MDKDNIESYDFDREIQKEIELNIEKDKVEDTIKIINDEILNYIEKRKLISDYIIKYRKQVLEEYKDDEDKVAEYFDHEKFVIEQKFKFIDKKLRELNILVASPYFGKVNIKEEEFGEEPVYIGRFDLTPEDSYEPLVVDWRAPVASLFYSGRIGKESYEAPMGKIDVELLSKRQFIIKKAKLLGMFDSELDVKDEILQMVLSSNCKQKLKDIIMTIQEEQDRLIRQPKNKTVVVDGVAGSGKTTIVLHRIAYLLYNFRKNLENKVLILGPNNIFMEYISRVLPSLGEVGVRQTTFKDFALELLGVDSVMSFKDYMENILNRNDSFKEDVIYKSSEDYIDVLNNLINTLEDSCFKLKDVKFDNKVIVSSKEINEMFYMDFKTMPLFRRSKKIKRIIFSRLKDCRNEIVRQIQSEHDEKISKLTKEELETEENNLNYLKRVKIRDVIEKLMKVKKELKWIDNPDVLDVYKKLNNDKPLIYDDLAAILYLKIKLEGLKINEEIKHIVIDEAQDYSKLQFIVIQQITKCKNYTIVGDGNQRIIPIKGNIPMEDVEKYMDFIDVERFKLNKSYRSTKEIMEYSNKYLKDHNIVPMVRNGEQVLEKHIDNEEELRDNIIKDINILKEKGYESIAVVCRDLSQTESIGKLIKSKKFIKIIDRENIIYEGGEVIIPSYFAKGLEFDSVILVDSHLDDKDNIDKLKYVMATRALHELIVYKIQ